MITERQRILIVLLAGIGDLILASPALRAIRNGFPQEEIHLLTTTDAAPLAKHYDFVSHVWPLPIRELRRSKRYLLDIFNILRTLRKISFHSALNLYHIDSAAGAFKMGMLFRCLKAPVKIGHDAHGFSSFLTHPVPTDFFQNRHVTESMTALAVIAGGIPDKKGIEMFWNAACEHKWVNIVDRKAQGCLLIGINPGGDRQNRRWGPLRYAAVADQFAARFDATILLFGGPGEEGIAREVRGHMKHEAIDLSGKLSLDDLGYLISRLDLLVTNDSAPMHIAAATNTPVVALFGPEDPFLMGPYTQPHLFRILYHDVPCRPCVTDRCVHPRCLELISPDEVLEKGVKLLKIHKPSLYDC